MKNLSRTRDKKKIRYLPSLQNARLPTNLADFLDSQWKFSPSRHRKQCKYGGINSQTQKKRARLHGNPIQYVSTRFLSSLYIIVKFLCPTTLGMLLPPHTPVVPKSRFTVPGTTNRFRPLPLGLWLDKGRKTHLYSTVWLLSQEFERCRLAISKCLSVNDVRKHSFWLISLISFSKIILFLHLCSLCSFSLYIPLFFVKYWTSSSALDAFCVGRVKLAGTISLILVVTWNVQN